MLYAFTINQVRSRSR